MGSEVKNPAGDLVPVYAWGQWPAHLLTKKQMGDAGLQTGAKLPDPAGAVWRSKSPGGVMWLYDRHQGVPKRAVSDAQRAALAKAQRLSERIDYTCDYCGRPLFRRAVTRKQAEVWGPTLCEFCEDHNRAIRWAREQLQQGCLLLDTETTRFEGEIIQIAVIDHEGAPLLDTLVMPRRPWAMFERGERGICAHDIHGIDVHDVCQASGWATVSRRLVDIVESQIVLTYNLDFDRGMIDEMDHAAGLPALDTSLWACLMKMYAQFVGDWSSYWGSYRYQPLNGGHTALSDCRAALEVLHHMASAPERVTLEKRVSDE